MRFRSYKFRINKQPLRGVIMKMSYLIAIALIVLAALFYQLIRRDLEMVKISLLWTILLAIIYTTL